MGSEDKMHNAAQDAMGKAKEGLGSMVGDEQLEAEGKMDQAKAEVKEKVEDVKDWAAEKFNASTNRGDK